MTRRTLIAPFICVCCLLEVGNAMAQNDREQKLLEVQATNAQAENAARNNANSTSPSTARPYYGPTNGVFGGPPPARAVPPTTGATAGTVPLLKK